MLSTLAGLLVTAAPSGELITDEPLDVLLARSRPRCCGPIGATELLTCFRGASIGSVEHPLAGNPTAALASLKAQDWVSTAAGDACDQLLHNACLAVGFRPRVRHRANDWLAILALVEAQMGVALVPRRANLPVPRGVAIVSPAERIRRHIYAIVRCGSTNHRPFEHGFGLSETLPADSRFGDPVDLSWARRFALCASYALNQPLPYNQVGVGRNAFAHESGIHADGALKDHGNYELYDERTLGPFPSDWHERCGRVVLTGEYGGKAGFRHVMDNLGVQVASADEDLVLQLVQLANAMTGRPLTDDELGLIASSPRQLALLFPGHLG